MNFTEKSVKESFLAEQALISNASSAVFGGKVVKDSDTGLFLYNALERIDPYLHKPMTRFYWQDAMPIMYGGGAIEFASFFRVNYNAYDANKFVTSGNNNIITTVKATIQKFQTMVKAYAWKIETGWIDEMKYRQVGSSILQQVEEGVRLYYNQKLDDVAFFGFVNEGITDAYGLFNNTNVVAITSDVVFTDTATEPLEIIAELNKLIAGIATRTQYNTAYITNHLLLPPSVYGALNQPMTIGSANGAIYTNVIDYFKNNNIVKSLYPMAEGIMILPNPYLETASSTGSRRAVAYCYDEACVRLPLPMDLTRGATMFNTQAMATETPFVTFVGSPQFVYPSTIGYLDNI